MPFGLCNAPVSKVLVYIDDIVILSPTFDKHCQDLQVVLSKLAESNDVLQWPNPSSFIVMLLMMRSLASLPNVTKKEEKESFAMPLVFWIRLRETTRLFGTHFQVFTDHDSLKWLMTAKLDSPRLSRWVRIQEIASLEASQWSSKGLVKSGRDSIGALIIFSLRSRNAFCAWSFHLKSTSFLVSSVRALAISENFGMNFR